MSNPRQKITRGDLLVVSRRLTHWQELARHLGLSEPDIAAIKADYSHDYNEQKLQSLLKWLQGQHYPPKRQALIKIIEEKMKDRDLARDVDRTLFALDNDRDGDRPRSISMLT